MFEMEVSHLSPANELLSAPHAEEMVAATGILDTFWRLSDVNESVREDAAVELLTHLAKRNVQSEIDYCLERLVRGLSSTHKAARLGFYEALVNLLRFLPKLVSAVEYMRLVKQHLIVKQRMKYHRKHVKQPKEASLFTQSSTGLCLGYAALVRSRRIGENSDILKQTVAELLHHCSRNGFYRELCAIVIVQTLERVPESMFKLHLWSSFESFFKSGWDNLTCEKFWLALVCCQRYPRVLNGDYLTNVWGVEDCLFHVDAHSDIVKVFMLSSPCHPRLHPVCMHTMRAMYAKSPNDFFEFWAGLTDHALVNDDVRDKQFLIFNLLNRMLDEMDVALIGSANNVPRIIRPCFVRQLVDAIAHPQLILHGMSVQLANALVSFVSKVEDSTVQLEVIKCLLLPPGSFSFDQVTRSSTISSMISRLKADTIRSLISFLKASFLGEKVPSEMHRLSAIQLLSRVITISPAAKFDTDIRTDILRFLVLHAFFDHIESTDDVDQCDRNPCQVSTAMHDKARNQLFGCLAMLSAKGRNRLPSKSKAKADGSRLSFDVIPDLLAYVDSLLRNPHVASPLLQDDFERITKVRKMIEKTLKVVRRIGDEMPDAIDSHTFQLLFIHLAMHLLSDDANGSVTMEALKDVHACFANLQNPRNSPSFAATVKSGDEPVWVIAVVELLIGLLALAPSVPWLCSLVDDVFAPLVDSCLTVEAFDRVLRALEDAIRQCGDEDECVDADANANDDDDDNIEDDENNTKSTSVERSLMADGERSSSSEDSDDDDDDVIDVVNDPERNENLRKAVKAALGEAADDSEQTDEDDDDDDDECDVVLDDDAMMRLDATLSEAFRSAATRGRGQMSTEEESSVQFINRCIDLINAVIIRRPTISFLLAMIFPLMQTIDSFLKDKVQKRIAQKALNSLDNLCFVKQFCDDGEAEPRLNPQTPSSSSAESGSALGTFLRDLVTRFGKASNYKVTMAIAETSTFVVRCAIHVDNQIELKAASKKAKPLSTSRARKHKSRGHTDENLKKSSRHVEECLEVYRNTLLDYFDNGECHTPCQMFSSLVKRYLHLGWRLADVLQLYAFRPEVRLFKRTKAVAMLSSLMSNCSLVLQVVGVERWSNLSDDIQPMITQNLESFMTDIKPKLVSEMLTLTAKVATLDRKCGRPLSTASWSAISDVLQRLALVKGLNKYVKKEIKSLCNLLNVRSTHNSGNNNSTRQKKWQQVDDNESELDGDFAPAMEFEFSATENLSKSPRKKRKRNAED